MKQSRIANKVTRYCALQVHVCGLHENNAVLRISTGKEYKEKFIATCIGDFANSLTGFEFLTEMIAQIFQNRSGLLRRQ